MKFWDWTYCCGFQWPMLFEWVDDWYDGPMQFLHLGFFWVGRHGGQFDAR